MKRKEEETNGEVYEKLEITPLPLKACDEDFRDAVTLLQRAQKQVDISDEIFFRVLVFIHDHLSDSEKLKETLNDDEKRKLFYDEVEKIRVRARDGYERDLSGETPIKLFIQWLKN